MNTLTFEINPSPTSNDHEVRILVDGEDWLGDDYLGIDPPHFFAQQSLTSTGELLVGRCACGCEGCDDVWVDMSRNDHEVLWRNAKGLRLHFDRQEYDKLIASAREDFSWEDTNRTAERLVSRLFVGVSIDNGYTLDWASARCLAGMMTLSFSKSGTQKLFEFGWDGRSAKDALAGAKRFYKAKRETDV